MTFFPLSLWPFFLFCCIKSSVPLTVNNRKVDNPLNFSTPLSTPYHNVTLIISLLTPHRRGFFFALCKFRKEEREIKDREERGKEMEVTARVSVKKKKMWLSLYPKMVTNCQKSKWKLGSTTSEYPWTRRSRESKRLTLKTKTKSRTVYCPTLGLCL